MTQTAIVVGGGIVGVSTAWYLAKRGYRVTVLERDALGAMSESASGGNAGLLSIGHFPLTRPGASMRGLRWMFSRTAPLYVRPRLDAELVSWMWNFHLHCTTRHLEKSMAVLGDMGFKSLAALEVIMEEANIACDYKRDGWLDVVLKPENLAAAEAEARSLEQYGYKWERIEKEQLLKQDPCFTPQVAGAIHMKDSAHCAPHLLIAGLVHALPNLGVVVRGNAEVRTKWPRHGRASHQRRGIARGYCCAHRRHLERRIGKDRRRSHSDASRARLSPSIQVPNPRRARNSFHRYGVARIIRRSHTNEDSDRK